MPVCTLPVGPDRYRLGRLGQREAPPFKPRVVPFADAEHPEWLVVVVVVKLQASPALISVKDASAPYDPPAPPQPPDDIADLPALLALLRRERHHHRHKVGAQIAALRRMPVGHADAPRDRMTETASYMGIEA